MLLGGRLKSCYKRFFLYGAAILFGLFMVYTLLCLIFINISHEESMASEFKLFDRRPDLIVVFTGDKGRIPKALEMAKRYNQPRIFITGVSSKNSIKTLLDPIDKGEGLDRNFLYIDYFARNTFENALATYRYIQNHQVIQKVLIISHDYHIMRIKKIMEAIQNPQENYEFHYIGVKKNYQSFRNIKILYKEVIKLMRTYIFLLLWEREINF